MLTDEQLLDMKTILTSEEIDDGEELLVWLVENGPDLIDEVIAYRSAAQQLGLQNLRHRYWWIEQTEH